MGIDVTNFASLANLAPRLGFSPSRGLMLGRQTFAYKKQQRKYYQNAPDSNGFNNLVDEDLIAEGGYSAKALSASRVHLYYEARKTPGAVLSGPAHQSDYVHKWKNHSERQGAQSAN